MTNNHEDRVPVDLSARSPRTVGLDEARALVVALARHESVLLLSPPGVGKTEMIHEVASSLGMPCRSLLGTQLAPEDVTGLPRLVNDRTAFCPPRLLAPEDGLPFVLFLDELPASSPEVQKAFYSLLLERRVGEHPLPEGTLVVAAGNRATDRALVRALSSALVNRVFVIEVEAQLEPWLAWAAEHGVRPDVRSFVAFRPDALSRSTPSEPGPFSTPRAWVSLSRALDLVEAQGALTPEMRRVLAFARVSPTDAELFSASRGEIPGSPESWIQEGWVCLEDSLGWARLDAVRRAVRARSIARVSRAQVSLFLDSLGRDAARAVTIGLEAEWRALGAPERLTPAEAPALDTTPARLAAFRG